MCLYQKFISKFTHTLIIVPGCFLIFWFCIKGNKVYYTWITYTLVLLVSIQLLFSHCVKYAEIRALSDPYFPVCGQNRFSIFPYLDGIRKYGYDSVHIQENMDQKKSLFGYISRRVLLNIFSHNSDLRENISFVSARKLFVSEYMNCLTAR